MLLLLNERRSSAEPNLERDVRSSDPPGNGEIAEMGKKSHVIVDKTLEPGHSGQTRTVIR